jgi:AraC-like DNA-binding protein
VTTIDSYLEVPPPPAWRHVVSCVWEQTVAAERVQRVLPDGHADLLIFDSGLMEVVGLADEAALPHLPAGTHLRGVRLRPEAVASAFEIDAADLRNQTVPAEDVFGTRRARSLFDDRALDGWLRSVRPDGLAAAAVQLLTSHSVSSTAHQLGLSSRQLQRILATTTGLTPKAFQRVARLQAFLRQAERGIPLATAGAIAGYADQSHLTREVRALSKVTPARLLTERQA